MKWVLWIVVAVVLLLLLRLLPDIRRYLRMRGM